MSSCAGGASVPGSDGNKTTRFQADLEFVQCLANPQYCLFLASSGMLEDEQFLGYLSYLRYWHVSSGRWGGGVGESE